MNTPSASVFHTFTPTEFETAAVSVFRFQYCNNPIYQDYCRHIHIAEESVCSLTDIPFLPISFFKTHAIKTTDFEPEMVFQSSGTTGTTPSIHYVKNLKIYEQSLLQSFSFFYGNPEDYVFLSLLPNYLEQTHSSLIYMMNCLMARSGHPENGFYLRNHKDLYQALLRLRQAHQKTILWGVTFALLDFIDHYQLDFPELIVFETGGMKGRRKEMVKEELYLLLEKAFGVPQIHSEYGMCELLSQAYSQQDNIFNTPPWMKLGLRDEKDPLAPISDISTGVINIIDLANLYSCSFISTEDLGRQHPNKGIEILGRIDNSQLRGCNLLVIPH